MAYPFEGHDWTELAKCWGITIDEQPWVINVKEETDPVEIDQFPEKII